MCNAKNRRNYFYLHWEKKDKKRRKIQIQELYRNLFFQQRGAAYHYELERLLSERDLRISPVLEIGNTETIINLLKRGMGVSFWPEFTVRKELKRGKLRQLDTDLPGVKMYSQLLHYKNKWITPQMQVFIDMVKGGEDSSLNVGSASL